MKYTILITPDREKDKPTARLRCRVTFSRQSVNVLVGYRVVLDKWSYDAQRCKSNSQHGQYNAQKINHEIDVLCGHISAILDAVDTITAEEFKKRLDVARNKVVEAPLTLLGIFDRYVDSVSRERTWSHDSHEKAAALRQHLSDYRGDIPLAKFDYDYLVGYVQWCIDEKMRNTSTLKQVDYLKMFLRWGEDADLIGEWWHKWKPRLKTAPKKIIFLTWDELMKVKDYPLPHEYQKRVRDVFCFCSMSGLRYSDVARLKKSDIVNDRISVTSLKDHDSLEINLNDYSREILVRYVNDGREMALPVPSNQKYNDYIKEVMELCEIDEPTTVTYYIGAERFDEVRPKHELISTHAARRTFICNALSLGIPPTVVMKWTGHSDYKAMKPYIDIADKVKQDEMAKFNRPASRKNGTIL